jgi:REP element-mobilizing transposase RayT
MHFVPGNIYHIYNRGNNQQRIFFGRRNYLFFLKKVKKELTPHCDILAWCLMPNHFHLMVYYPEATPGKPCSKDYRMPRGVGIVQPINRSIATVLSSYTKAINREQRRTGSLFQQKTKAKPLTGDANTDYPFVCFHYIHQNPLRARLVAQLEDWEFSSFRDYAGLRGGTLANKALACQFIGVPSQAGAFYDQSYQVMGDDKVAGIF